MRGGAGKADKKRRIEVTRIPTQFTFVCELHKINRSQPPVVPSSVLYRLYRNSRVHDRGFHISIERARAPIMLYARVFTLRAHEFVRYRADVRTRQ